jgi:hypothetical protein
MNTETKIIHFPKKISKAEEIISVLNNITKRPDYIDVLKTIMSEDELIVLINKFISKISTVKRDGDLEEIVKNVCENDIVKNTLKNVISIDEIINHTKIILENRDALKSTKECKKIADEIISYITSKKDTFENLKYNILNIISNVKKRNNVDCVKMLDYLIDMIKNVQGVLKKHTYSFLRKNETDIHRYLVESESEPNNPDFRLDKNIIEKLLIFNNECIKSGWPLTSWVVFYFLCNEYFFRGYLDTGNVITIKHIKKISNQTDDSIVSRFVELRSNQIVVSQDDVEAYISGEYSWSWTHKKYPSKKITIFLLTLPHIRPTQKMLENAILYGNYETIDLISSTGVELNQTHLHLITKMYVDMYENDPDIHQIIHIGEKYDCIVKSVEITSKIFKIFVDSFYQQKHKRFAKKGEYYRFRDLELMVLDKGYIPDRNDIMYALTKKIYIKNPEKYNLEFKDIYKPIFD